MSRSTFVNFRRFSAGAEVAVVSDVTSRRREVRVAESVVGVGDGSRSLSTGELFLDDFVDADGSTALESSVGMSSFDVDVMLLFVDESSTSGGCSRCVDDRGPFLDLHFRGAF